MCDEISGEGERERGTGGEGLEGEGKNVDMRHDYVIVAADL